MGAISLQNLEQLRADPKSIMDNLVINDVNQLVHELSSMPQCLICTSCNDFDKMNRLLQYCQHIDIAIGYQHNISKQLNNLPLYSVDNLIKKLEMEITMGTNNLKPAFIGIINYEEIDFNNQIWINIMESYIYCSESCGIPIVVDHNHRLEFKEIQQKYNLRKAKFIILNPYVEVKITKQNYFIKREINIESVDLKQKIVFNKNEVDYELYSLLPVYFTVGIKHKTHLKMFGGNGFEIVKSETQELFDLLKWSSQIIKIVEIKMWKCPMQ
ncbi:unnamed protein product (macronuclear) [Paramecium tetraurelia]|uniref:Uncharacterized protein n=1 Tax=Paramecium tetraurelia TaxID=5888 RepID=A0CGK1_PARTE|nr:uncharacterized protein GSPATT00007358001 [Paramecium tetraurelia]CAK69918.1 unnamed protein product [Paramecium tetraurelia]|eukprot:XP_001437315.1 hypothetical protein (macronuclear) [Paramecium tetraurelia strain d4-2]